MYMKISNIKKESNLMLSKDLFVQLSMRMHVVYNKCFRITKHTYRDRKSDNIILKSFFLKTLLNLIKNIRVYKNTRCLPLPSQYESDSFVQPDKARGEI